MKKATCMMGLLIVFMWVNALAYAVDAVVLANPEATGWHLWIGQGTCVGNGVYYIDTSDTGAEATWRMTCPETGNYNVYACWVAEANRATNAPYTIYYKGEDSKTVSATVRVSQKIRGGQWNYLGSYSLCDGITYSVVLSDDDVDGRIIANAIKFEHAPPPSYKYPIVDNPDADVEGGWLSWDCSGWPDCSQLYGEDLYYIDPSDTGKVTWRPEIPETGNYNVYALWFAHPDRATNAPYTIYYDGGSETIRVDQQINGGQWNQLGTGTYAFAEGACAKVVLTNDGANGRVIADAIKWERVQQ